MKSISLQGTDGLFYATTRSACFDITSKEDIEFPPFDGTFSFKAVPTGITWNVISHEEGRRVLVARVYPRSGLCKRGLMMVNSPGIIDEDYEGEWHVLLVNMTDRPVSIKAGERIAQCEIGFSEQCELINVKNNIRGSGGFGSTGN